MSQSPLFVKTYELVLWLMRKTVKFPREHRFVTARFVQEAALRFQERLIEAAARPKGNQWSIVNDQLSIINYPLTIDN